MRKINARFPGQAGTQPEAASARAPAVAGGPEKQ